MRFAEVYFVTLAEEKEKQAVEADELKKELLFAKAAERNAKNKLVTFLSQSIIVQSTSTESITDHRLFLSEQPEFSSTSREHFSRNVISDNEIDNISKEIEREK